MDTIISTCGWLTFGIIATAIALFALGFFYGIIKLGIHISTRQIRESNRWKKVVAQQNLAIIRNAAFTLRDRLNYGGDTTLNDILEDTYKRMKQ